MRIDGHFSLVLGGGGLKGMAHIGVFQALEEVGMTPDLVVGCSMGSLIAGAWAAGLPVAEMRDIALSVVRKDIFQVAHADMAFKRMRAPAVYRPEPLDALIGRLVADRTFRELERRLVVATVDLRSGAQVLWGLPGLDHVQVREAIFGSCALPGIFPPREVDGRLCVDGAVAESLPVRIAASECRGPVLAVHVGATSGLAESADPDGFAATYVRALEMVMHSMLVERLRGWESPPLLLVHPRVEHVGMFTFDHTRELIDEGYRATMEALEQLPEGFPATAKGMYPRRIVEVSVEESRCVGCGACVMAAPAVFALGPDRKARVLAPRQEWSPVDGGYVRGCPTFAIRAQLPEPPA
ncbi:MAG TPA: patatin-like phospholipase family protein [Gemmatimonadales bacterium]|nr:patatin-like phospholipase family protein [Gemmatimonadales bacterium]